MRIDLSKNNIANGNYHNYDKQHNARRNMKVEFIESKIDTH